MQRHAEVLAGVIGASQQHRRLRRGHQPLGNPPVTLLLYGEHGRQLVFRQQAAVPCPDLLQQSSLHRWGIGMLAR
ncbi:hypothetical protein D3C79_464850 [compost metagenome]